MALNTTPRKLIGDCMARPRVKKFFRLDPDVADAFKLRRETTGVSENWLANKVFKDFFGRSRKK